MAALKIVTDYLKDDSVGNKVSTRRRANNILRKLSSKDDCVYHSPAVFDTVQTQCSESDSVQTRSATSSENTALIHKSFPPKWTHYFSLNKSRNAIKIIGGPVDQVCQYFENMTHKKKSGDVHTKIPFDTFDLLDSIVFSYLSDIYFESFKGSNLWTRHHDYMCLAGRSVEESDFSTHRALGKGGFGLVTACKRKTTGKMFAMKKLHKKGIKQRKGEAMCLLERKVLATIRSPYVVALMYAFATPTELNLILDLMTGGDLGFHLNRKGRFTEKETKYYAARTLLGLAAMHEKNIAHRDIKPENILMDEEGYTKISDLGLACKVGKSGLSGTCGTRGYWAPEMVRRDAQDRKEKYTVSVDWFSFGCCLYEFMYGISPFRTEKARKWGDFPKEEKNKAIDLAIQQMEPDYDESVFNPVIKDLISKLLLKDGKQRLGANGFLEIASHPWFACKFG